MTVEELRDIYGVKIDDEIGAIFGVKGGAVSAWRKNGIPAKVILAAQQKQKADGTTSRHITRGENIDIPQDAFRIPAPVAKIPIVSWAQAGPEGYFEDSHSVGFGYGEINRPYDVTDTQAYALIISGDSMSPKFEPGDVVIVSPAAAVMTGDYAIVRLKDGEVTAKRIKAKNGHHVLQSINPEYPERIVQNEDIVFVHRIVWVKQRG